MDGLGPTSVAFVVIGIDPRSASGTNEPVLPLPHTPVDLLTNGTKVFTPKPQSSTSAVFPVDLGPWQDLDMSSAHPSFVDDHGMDMGFGVEMGMGMGKSYPKTSFDVSMQAFSSTFGGAHEGVLIIFFFDSRLAITQVGEWGSKRSLNPLCLSLTRYMPSMPILHVPYFPFHDRD